MPIHRLAAVGVAVIALSGCAVPVGVGVIAARYGAEAGLYIGTGRGLTDHALTQLTGDDCVTFRVLEGEEICQEWSSEDVVGDEVLDTPAAAPARFTAVGGIAPPPPPATAAVPRYEPASVTVETPDELLFARPERPASAWVIPSTQR